jgi:hypothetical protein
LVMEIVPTLRAIFFLHRSRISTVVPSDPKPRLFAGLSPALRLQPLLPHRRQHFKTSFSLEMD